MSSNRLMEYFVQQTQQTREQEETGESKMSKLEDVFTKEDLKQMMDFAEFACKTLKGVKRGVEVEFKCPICGGKAYAGANTYNGHRHGKCESCGQAFIE